MAAKKVGTLIKEARTAAGLSQAALAEKLKNISAADISKVERGEKDFSDAELKQIAKILGVTQKSLVEAPKNLKTSSSSKPASSKPAASSSSGKTKVELSSAEKKLVEAYREADAATRKAALAVLKGEVSVNDDDDDDDNGGSLIGGLDISNILSSLLGKLGG